MSFTDDRGDTPADLLSPNVLSTSPPNRLNPLKNPSTPRMHLDTPDDVSRTRDRSHDRSPRRAQVLNLERMQITQRRSPATDSSLLYTYPNSRKLLPPTPVHDELSRTASRVEAGNSKESSPRSEDEAPPPTPRLTTSMSVIKEGHFRIEETQVHSSTDSGCPEDKGSSDSKNSSIESSVSNLSSGSNSNLANLSETRRDDDSISASDKKDKLSKGLSLGVRQNTGFVRLDTGRSSERGPSRVSSKGPLSSASDNRSTLLSRSSSVGKGDTETAKMSAKLRTVAKENRQFSSKPGSSRANQSESSSSNTELRKSIDSALSSRVQSGQRNKVIIHEETVTESGSNLTTPGASSTQNQKRTNQVSGSRSRGAKAANVQPGALISRANESDSISSRSQGHKTVSGSSAQKVDSDIPLTKDQPQVLQLKGATSQESKNKSIPKRTNSRNTTITRVQVNDDVHKSQPISATRQQKVSRQSSNTSSTQPKVIHVQEAALATADTKPSSGKNQPNSSQRPMSKTTAKSSANPGVLRQNSSQSSKGSALKVPSQKKPSLSPRQNSSSTSGLSKPTSSNAAKVGPSQSVLKTRVNQDSNSVIKAGYTPDITTSSESSSDNNQNVREPKPAFTNSLNVNLHPSASSPALSSMESSGSNMGTGAYKMTSKTSQGSNPEITAKPGVTIQFNNGETPTAPPRKKRSPLNRSDSAGSNTSDITTPGNSQNITTTGISQNKTPSATNISSVETDQNQNIKKDLKPQSRSQQSTGNPVKPRDSNEALGRKKSGVTEEHTGPKIWDPFESLNARRQKEISEALEKERALEREQRLKSANNKTRKVVIEKTKPERQVSANKNKRRTSKATTGDEAKKRPKSSTTKKRKGKSKKKEDKEKRLTDKDEDNTVALIGGIGWHIETDCNDRTDVQAVQLQSDSSDDESEQEINIRVLPDYGIYDETSGGNRRSSQEVTITLSRTLPGQISDESSEDDDSDGSEFEDIPECAEVVHEEVQYIFGQTSPVSRLNQCIELQDSDNDSDIEPNRLHHPEQHPHILPLTENALRDFESAMTSHELDNLLGPKYAGVTTSVVKNTQKRDDRSEHITVRGLDSLQDIERKKTKQNDVTKKSHATKFGNKANPVVNTLENEANLESSQLRRVNSLPNRQKRQSSNSTNRRRPRHASISEKQDDADDKEIDTMIAEILKDTPNPSLSLHSKRSDDTKARSMTREEFEDALNNDGGISFRQVPNSSTHKRTNTAQNPLKTVTERNTNATSFAQNRTQFSEDRGQTENTSQNTSQKQSRNADKNSSVLKSKGAKRSHLTRDIEDVVKDRTIDEHQELMDWKDKVENLKEKERREMEKLMNTVKNMGLKVDLDSPRAPLTKSQSAMTRPSDYTQQKEPAPVASKPPRGPKNASPPKQSERLPEKSPRFVRRRDTLKKSSQENIEDDAHVFPADTLSSFGSVDLSAIAGTGGPGDSFVADERSEVVTSRLGPKGGQPASRANSAMSNATDDIGDVIQWKRGNMLGKGAYGIVWCGLTNAGELIAVKQIELNITDMEKTEAEYEKIQEEVELLKTLRHKNIVGYLGTSLEDNIVSIFMQFVPGGSVANLLARFGALDEEVFCNYTKQILEGVEYLHANNVIHRDIKGGNIMLMHNGVIKLIDFGCAKRLCLNVSTKAAQESQSRLLKSMRGTPYWMAPEVVKETGHGTKSDIWSIGCTVYEMATRNPPWADMPQMTAIFAIGSDSKPIPQLPDKFSQDARDFYALCLTRDANSRPSAIALLKHAFILRRRKSRANSLAQLS